MRSDQTHGRLLQSVMDDFDDGLLSTVTELCRDAHICLTTFLVVIKFSVTIVSRVDVIMQAMMCAHVSLDHTRYRPIHIRSRCKSVAPSGPALSCGCSQRQHWRKHEPIRLRRPARDACTRVGRLDACGAWLRCTTPDVPTPAVASVSLDGLHHHNIYV
jgi:hypothetical protein